ncbi:PEP-utilising enzyme, mobile domain [Brevibacterium siliguriense]|uniref:PEP-utilising enzyme, mobile domain n=1 Tax=Brevibacterium siliguriense TaxID=1136497 RepID=A0A1H1QVR8_9MICO|nr:PEP/pyruvate-binding domain-containing protein [Brevibacterium siliguriense]SDS27455.1 PEP-utilising enzyme, mobile domain [Brevibacterium siliguriense]
MSLTLRFTDPLATELARSGGKGASLAKSAQNLPVPGGFIVTADAYSQFIAPLQSRITELIGTDSPAEAIADFIRATPIPAAWLSEFDEAVAEAGLTGHAVAVRSSGTMEDLPGAAFAGQHDTYLGVRGTAAIAEAVRDCYASLWNEHAFRYRRQLGVDQLEAKMAVVVQLMVSVGADEAAGVAFSVDPVRGNTDEVLINAAFGLGETVVGGEDPVDEFRVHRDSGDQVAAEIAEKPTALIMRGAGDGLSTGFGDGGDRLGEGGDRLGEGDGRGDGRLGVGDDARTTVVDLGEEQRTRPALTAEQTRAVAELAVAAENHFGFAQDIEWALHDGDLYLLQSRPITRVAPRWTRDESAERFPTPVTPLTWDLVEAGFHHSLNHSFDLMGLPPFDDKWFVMRDFYIYGNQTAVDLYAGRLPTAMLSSVEAITESLPQIAQQFGWVQELPVQWMRDLDTYLIGIGRLSHEPLEEKTLGQVWDHVIAISDLGTEYFRPNIAISLTQGTLYAALQHMLSLALDEDQAQVVFERLMASTETKTSQVNAELRELSQLVAADADLLAALEAHHGEAGVSELERFPQFKAVFDRFLAQHGHRELDFDAYYPTWVEAPHIVLDQIRLLAARTVAEAEAKASDAEGGPNGAGDGAPKSGAGAAPMTDMERKVIQAETELAVVNAAPEKLRYLVQEVIRLARTYTALDDLEHYQTTRLTLPMRRALRELGGRLVDAGVLDEASDVYFIDFEHLDTAIRADAANREADTTDAAAGTSTSTATGSTGTGHALTSLTEIAAQNKAAYQAAVERTPEWEYGRATAAVDSDTDHISGTAGSPGTVEGEVFVVHSPADFSSFPDGAILVARTTNPAWTALFYQAGGVITESGGALSHGAVTARELGLPAVMAVRDATSRFTSGQRVRVDGSNGTVVELD